MYDFIVMKIKPDEKKNGCLINNTYQTSQQAI